MSITNNIRIIRHSVADKIFNLAELINFQDWYYNFSGKRYGPDIWKDPIPKSVKFLLWVEKLVRGKKDIEIPF
jgi:hypothetical protein